MVGEFSPWHLLIVAIVFIVLFGSRKLPDASRSLGRSLRIFKSEMDGMKNEFKAGATEHTATPTPSAAPTPQSPASPEQPPAALPPADQTAPPAQQPVAQQPVAQQPVAAAVPQDTPPEQPKA